VSLVAVAQLGGQGRPVLVGTLRRALGRFVQPVPADDPLGPDAHVALEEPLQPAGRGVQPLGQRLDPGERRVGGYLADQSPGLLGPRIALRYPREQCRLHRGRHPGVVGRGDHRALQRVRVDPVEQLLHREPPAGQLGDRAAQVRVEAAGPERRPDRPALVSKRMGEVTPDDALDRRAAPAHHEVHHGVGQDPLLGRLAPAQVPADRPVHLDERGQYRVGREPLQPERGAGDRVVQHRPGPPRHRRVFARTRRLHAVSVRAWRPTPYS